MSEVARVRRMDLPTEDGPEDLESFLARVRPRLQALLWGHGIPPEDAEDVLQQSLMAYLGHRETVRDPEAWLVAVLHRQSLLYWRSRRRCVYRAMDPQALEWLAPAEPPPQVQVEMGQDLRAALQTLPPRHRRFALLRFGLGMGAGEVADRMGYRASSVGKLTSRCRRVLQRRLSAGGWSPPAPPAANSE